MAFPLPLLLGAAALLLVGGKKRRSRKTTKAQQPPVDAQGAWKSYAPPKGDQSVPISTAPPATPAKPPNLSPFSSVKQFQQALIQMGIGVGPKGADGAWGKNTSAAISSFQSKAGLRVTGSPNMETLTLLYSKAFNSPGPSECDPLDPSGLSPYEGCFERNGRFVVLPLDTSALPPVSESTRNNSVIFSPDLTNVHIGLQWRYRVLEKWLLKKKDEGKVGLSATKKTLEWISEHLVRDPSLFLGAGNETVGGIVYAVLIVIATRGAASKYFSAMFTSARAAKIASTALIWFGIADGAAGAAGLFNVFTAAPKELLDAQMMVLINEFAEEHKVLVGNEWVPLKDVPLDNPGSDHLLRQMMDWVARFQRYQYD